jgi:hypothetical protein
MIKWMNIESIESWLLDYLIVKITFLFALFFKNYMKRVFDKSNYMIN